MSPVRLTKMESAMRTVLAFTQAFNRHDVDGMMDLMSEDCLFEDTYPPPDGDVYTGKKTVTEYWRDFFRRSLHAHIDIEDVFGLGDRCIMRWRYSWVDEKGEKGHVRGADIYLVRDGAIREKLSYVKG